MWLVSVSKIAKDRIVPALKWNRRTRKHVDRIIEIALRGVGDMNFERSFAMCVTQCRHRGLSDAEIAILLTGCVLGRGLAGAPLRVYWQVGIPDDMISAQPCHNPGKRPLGNQPDLYLVEECGACPTCAARGEIEARYLGPAAATP